METKFRHILIAGLTAVGLGLAGCGGGGSSSTPPATGSSNTGNQTSTVAMERTAISNAIAAAQTAVGMVTDDASDATVTAADTAIAAAKKAIADAANVPAEEKTANSGTVAQIETALSNAKTSRTAAMKDTNTADAKAAVALFNGFGDATNFTVTISAVTDKHGGGGMASFTSDALVPGVGRASVTKSAEPMQGMWQGTMLTDAIADDAATNPGTSSTVVVYTDIEAAKSVPFGDVYDLDANGNLASANVISAANRPKVKAPAFTHTGRKNHDPDPDDTEDVAMVRGTFNGASGEYRCTASSPTACASHDAGKGVVRLEGTWTFDPDSGAMAMEADADYAYFGWWLNKGTTTEGVEAGVFHGMTGGTALTAADFQALGGTATYKGAAAGKYAINPGLSSASGGHWTANATLTADFGTEATDGTGDGTISGVIDGFMAGDEAMDWSVALGETPFSASGSFDTGDDGADGNAVVWTIGGVAGAEAGAWSGALHEAGDNNVPTVATGMFTATHGTVGHMVGAFGAHVEK